jgi:pimeloyl-ACP methyl ester carboxylesterase
MPVTVRDLVDEDGGGSAPLGPGWRYWARQEAGLITRFDRLVRGLTGEGDGRAVVFVHGNSSSARTWLPVLTGPFRRRFRCLAFDLPGHGQSAPAADHSAYSLPGYAAVLAAFTQACGAADAVIASARAGSPTRWRSPRPWGGRWRSCTVRVSNW